MRTASALAEAATEAIRQLSDRVVADQDEPGAAAKMLNLRG